MGTIIAGFATCGKSILGKKYSNVIDLESSPFKNIMRTDLPVEEQKGTIRELNPLWPQNYYDAILEANYLTDVHTEIGLNVDSDMCKALKSD